MAFEENLKKCGCAIKRDCRLKSSFGDEFTVKTAVFPSDFTAAANEYNYIQKYGDGTYTFEKLLENAGVGSPFEEDTYEEIAEYLDTLV